MRCPGSICGMSRHDRGRTRLTVLLDAARSSIWPAPTAGILFAVLLGVALPELDEQVDSHLPGSVGDVLFGGGAEAARAVLSAIAGSLITATSLTFSLTVVALQLASSQASPRLLRLFAADRMVHATMTVFLGTFAYVLTVLRTITGHDADSEEFVPRIAVTLASVFTLVSLVMLALFLAHLARQLRVDTMLSAVSEEARSTLERMPEPDDAGPPVSDIPRPRAVYRVSAAESGFLISIDHDELVELATQLDLVIAEEWTVGSSVVAGVPLAHWWDRGDESSGDDAEEIERRIRQAFRLASERTAVDDIAFALRQFVDVALKAVSPGVNDPTTAVHALSHASALLCAVVHRPAEPSTLTDDRRAVRVIRQPLSVPSLLELTLGQLRHYGAGDPDVVVRMIQLLREVGFANRRHDLIDPIREQVHRLLDAVAQKPFDRAEQKRIQAAGEDALTALAGVWTPAAEAGPLLDGVPVNH